ncbi:isochorismate synthase [Aequorivita capsosiphonis]|uniref:isochorismate synthase n=1 Tax=Aequorivita capsosiphonis TaxID=487317 RepID=UPI0004196407|nr:isochorismate synthase [Aequorivita capsosiphonis]
MDFNLLSKKVAEQYNKNLPFVIYSLPEKDRLQALFQKDDRLHAIKELNESGFVLAPFDYKESSFFISEKESEAFQTEFEKDIFETIPVAIPSNEDEENIYIKLLQKTIDTIKRGEASKIVIARPKAFELKGFSIEKLIKRLFSAYPTAFRYIWYHPETGLWCGATPEILVEMENNLFKTMALAGTQPYINNEPVIWRAKEQNEQQQVTDMIVNKLKLATSSLEVSDTYTHRAGSLLHLRTDIIGKLNNGTTLTAIAEALHPTPAVGGNPKKFSQEFIIKNEDYSREFYTGFVGPILNNGSSASLMVNLRCMKIKDNTARIYVGGGITSDSNPKEEWQETQNKMQTMLQVLQPML